MKILRKINLKNKILNTLILYFTISLVIFSIFLGSLFAYMFVRNTINFNKAILEKRALKIADTISVLWYGDREFRLSKRLSDDPNFQKKDKIYEKRQKFEFEQYTPVLNIKDLETFKNKNLTFENSNLLSSQNDFFEEEFAELYYLAGSYEKSRKIYSKFKIQDYQFPAWWLRFYFYSLKQLNEIEKLQENFKIVLKIKDEEIESIKNGEFLTECTKSYKKEEIREIKRQIKNLKAEYEKILKTDYKPEVKIYPKFLYDCFLIDCPRHQKLD